MTILEATPRHEPLEAAASLGPATVWAADGGPTPERDYGTGLAERLESMGYVVSRRDLTAVHGDEELAPGLHVLSGGGTSVNDLRTWMPAGLAVVGRMVGAATEGKIQLFGVCLGSQMIAEVLAPGCIVRGATIQVGLADLSWEARSSFGPLPYRMPSFHFEQINRSSLEAAGAVVAASNDRVPVLAYRFGPNVGATQLHPELTLPVMVRLVHHHHGTIHRFGGDATEVLRQLTADAPWDSQQLFEASMHELVRSTQVHVVP